MGTLNKQWTPDISGKSKKEIERKFAHMNSQLLRNIPKVDLFLEDERFQEKIKQLSKKTVKDAVNRQLGQIRKEILEDRRTQVPPISELKERVLKDLDRGTSYSLRRVINAAGVMLHTNLGRAPLGADALEHLKETAEGYCNLEYDLEKGSRGSRYAHLEESLCRLTGAPGAMAVNNNAAAVFLILHALANGKNVAVSRGELVEIGGSFRVPDIMEESGAHLIETGTTNKTHEEDYERAVTQKGAQILLKVHTSNFKILGFSEEVTLDTLTRLGRRLDCPVFYDMGAGFLIPGMSGSGNGLEQVRACMETGVDLLCFSGDKLMGAAQAGIILGKKEYIEKIKRDPLTRMVRIDKLSLAVLEYAVHALEDEAYAKAHLPFVSMYTANLEELEEKARRLQGKLAAACGLFSFEIQPCQDETGGGSLPGETFEGRAVTAGCPLISSQELEELLRQDPVPVIVRKKGSRVWMSVRTLFEKDEAVIVRKFQDIEKKLRETNRNIK